MSWPKSEYPRINLGWNVSPDFKIKVWFEVKFKCFVAKELLFLLQAMFFYRWEEVNADGKLRRILMTLVLTWDWDFLTMPVFNLILMQLNLVSYFRLLFLTVTFHWNFLPFGSLLDHDYIRCIIHHWSLSKQHFSTSEVCWEPEPRQMYFPINHAAEGCDFTSDMSVVLLWLQLDHPHYIH